jgi:protein ImuB
MRRIVSVWLPDWPVTVWSRAAGRAPPDPAASFALTERSTHGLVLAATNPAARAAGLRRGQGHADACAILPALNSHPAEPERELQMLRRLALWAERFSPGVAADRLQPGFEGLMLDMTGGAHLFGGEGALLAEIERRLETAGIPARAGMADTAGAAWALARFGDEKLAPAGRTREAIGPLPVEALRLEAPALKLLRRFGLKRIGDLYALPRAGLARRFNGEAGLQLVRRLDQALGGEGEPLEPIRPAPLYRAWRAFAEPLIDVEGVAWALPGLVEALAAQLERDGKGARRLMLTAFRTDGRTTSIEAGLSVPAAAPAHLLRLLKERGLERLDLGFGADALMVSAHKAEAAEVRQIDLAPDPAGACREALAALVDRIEARLGEGSALRPVLRDSHIPERSEAWENSPLPRSGGGAGEGASAEMQGALRPLLLLDPPEPIEAVAELPDAAPARFVWRRFPHKVARAEGPERLSPEWWRAPAGHERTRDYYRVEDEDGRRFWLYREGLYDREADPHTPPSWWLHGVFA